MHGDALCRADCQVEFEGSKYHMSLDRDVVTSLELLAPSRCAAGIQSAHGWGLVERVAGQGVSGRRACCIEMQCLFLEPRASC
jgi:hypothetical protein